MMRIKVPRQNGQEKNSAEMKRSKILFVLKILAEMQAQA